MRAVCEILRQESGPAIRATMVCPDATDTEFASDPDTREWTRNVGMSPDTVAEAIAYALGQPAAVNVGELVLRASAQS